MHIETSKCAESAGGSLSPLARASFPSLAATLREMADKMDSAAA